MSDAPPEIVEPGAEPPRQSDGAQTEPGHAALSPEAVLSRGGLTLSGGFSSIWGPNFDAKIARRNIGGLSREITASARYSKYQTLFEIGYADANFLGGSTVFAPSIFANRLSAVGFGNNLGSTPFRETARGFNLSLSRKFENGLAASGNYRISSDSFGIKGGGACDATLFGSPVCGALGRRISSIFSFAMTLDRRDSETDPTRGFKLRLTQDIAGLGGTARYTRTRIGGEAHFSNSNGWRLSIGAEAGIMGAMGKRDIPLFDRFYIGGTSLRGFDLRGIGPKIVPTGVAAGQAAAVAIGGRAYYAVRAELSMPVGGVLGNHGVQPCAFIDAGSSFGVGHASLLAGETLIGNSPRPRVSVGIGLALNTPVGRLRVDFAQPIIKQFGDRTRNFSISFGAAL